MEPNNGWGLDGLVPRTAGRGAAGGRGKQKQTKPPHGTTGFHYRDALSCLPTCHLTRCIDCKPNGAAVLSSHLSALGRSALPWKLEASMARPPLEKQNKGPAPALLRGLRRRRGSAGAAAQATNNHQAILKPSNTHTTKMQVRSSACGTRMMCGSCVFPT
jgi:hypothetical protein